MLRRKTRLLAQGRWRLEKEGRRNRRKAIGKPAVTGPGGGGGWVEYKGEEGRGRKGPGFIWVLTCGDWPRGRWRHQTLLIVLAPPLSVAISLRKDIIR